MAIYDRPVRILMKEMAQDFALQPGQSFSKQQAVDWFEQHYPKIKLGTITAHLLRLSTNATSRLHYNPRPGDDDLFVQIDRSHFRLFDARTDPAPIGGGDEPPPEPPDPDQEPHSTEFAYEADLRNYLAKNLGVIEPRLTLYEDEGITGIEFPVGGRYIDILAVDAQNNLVVIELKVSRGYDRVVGQILRYVGWIRQNLAEPGQSVRGIIVAREISSDLVLACSQVPNVELFEYQLSLSVKKIAAVANS